MGRLSRNLARLALFALPGLALPASSEAPAHAKAGPNVVLIVVDTLRADHLEQYGQAQETSAALADFAGRSTAYPDSSEMLRAVDQWLDADLRQRCFLSLQPMNAHGPYLVPDRHGEDLLGREARGGFEYYGSGMRDIMKRGRPDMRSSVSESMLESLREQYDVAVRHTMDRLGELFDHGGFSHGDSLHREVLHVPQLMKLPGQLSSPRTVLEDLDA